MSARLLLGHPRHPSARPVAPAIYVGTFASAKLDKSAVRRNRMRRRCREALRTELLSTTLSLPPVQLLLCPRSSSLDSPFAALHADIQRLLTFLATCQKPLPKNPAHSNS